MSPADIRKTADHLPTMDYEVVAETLRALADVVEALEGGPCICRRDDGDWKICAICRSVNRIWGMKP